MSDQFLTISVGELSGDRRKAYDCLTHIHHLFVREVKPRVPYFDLYGLALEEASRAGYPNDIKGFVFAELYSRYLREL